MEKVIYKMTIPSGINMGEDVFIMRINKGTDPDCHDYICVGGDLVGDNHYQNGAILKNIHSDFVEVSALIDFETANNAIKNYTFLNEVYFTIGKGYTYSVLSKFDTFKTVENADGSADSGKCFAYLEYGNTVYSFVWKYSRWYCMDIV